MREMIITFLCSSAQCGGYHKVLRQSDVKHNIYECFKFLNTTGGLKEKHLTDPHSLLYTEPLL